MNTGEMTPQTSVQNRINMVQSKSHNMNARKTNMQS